MKNILARGGIEFLAVLLGITVSLYLEEIKSKNNTNDIINESLVKIVEELNEIKINMNLMIEKFEDQKSYYRTAIEANNLNSVNSDELDIMNWKIQSPIARNINTLVYESIKSSGILYKIDNEDIKMGIIKLYGDNLERYRYTSEYERDYCIKFDQLILTDIFVLRHDESDVNWFLDWGNPINYDTYSSNIEFRNKLIALYNLKKLLIGRCELVIEGVDELISMLSLEIKTD